MTHTVEVIESKQLSDGEFAVLSQCCGDPMTKSWLTMASSVASDPDKSQASLEYHNSRVANLHEAAIQSTAILKQLVGQTFTITPSASPDPAPDPNSTTGA